MKGEEMSEAVILQNERDAVLGKIQKIKEEKLAQERKKEEIKLAKEKELLLAEQKEFEKEIESRMMVEHTFEEIRYKTLFTEYFIRLAKKMFDISSNDLMQMSKKELKTLSEEIAKKARPWAIFQAIMSLLLLVVPYIILSDLSNCGTWCKSYRYLYWRKTLLKNNEDIEERFSRDLLRRLNKLREGRARLSIGKVIDLLVYEKGIGRKTDITLIDGDEIDD